MNYNPTEQPARIRIIHAAAMGQPVDVYINDRPIIRGLNYRQQTQYILIPKGMYNVKIYSTTGNKLMLSQNIKIEGNQLITISTRDDQLILKVTIESQPNMPGEMMPGMMGQQMNPMMPGMAGQQMNPMMPGMMEQQMNPMMPGMMEQQMNPMMPGMMGQQMNPMMPGMMGPQMNPMMPGMMGQQMNPMMPGMMGAKMNPMMPGMMGQQMNPMMPGMMGRQMDSMMPDMMGGDMDPMMPGMMGQQMNPMMSCMGGEMNPMMQDMMGGEMNPMMHGMMGQQMNPMMPGMMDGEMNPMMPGMMGQQMNPTMPCMMGQQMNPMMHGMMDEQMMGHEDMMDKDGLFSQQSCGCGMNKQCNPYPQMTPYEMPEQIHPTHPRDAKMPQKAKVRFIHFSPNAPAVDITLPNGTVLFKNVPYKGVTDYIEIAPGTYTLQVRPTGTERVVLTIPNFVIRPNEEKSIYAIGLVNGTPGLEAVVLNDRIVRN